MFEHVLKFWDAFKKVKQRDLKRIVPNLTSLDKISLEKVSDDNRIVKIRFTNLSSAIEETTYLSTLKRYIIDFMKTMAVVKIENSPPDDLVLYLSDVHPPKSREKSSIHSSNLIKECNIISVIPEMLKHKLEPINYSNTRDEGEFVQTSIIYRRREDF